MSKNCASDHAETRTVAPPQIRVRNKDVVSGEPLHQVRTNQHYQVRRILIGAAVGMLIATVVTGLSIGIIGWFILNRPGVPDHFIAGAFLLGLASGAVSFPYVLRATAFSMTLTTDGAYVRNGRKHFWVPWTLCSGIESQGQGRWFLATIFCVKDAPDVEARVASARMSAYRGDPAWEINFVSAHKITHPTYMAEQVFSQHLHSPS